MSIKTEMSNAELLFSTFENKQACSNIQLKNYSDRCAFATEGDDCQDMGYYFNYVTFLYCVIEPYDNWTMAWGILVLVFFCIITFIVLGASADRVFCPALQVLSNEFGMSEHLAGVTVLAFGNGSPDLFCSMAALDEPSKMMFSDLYGAAILVHGFVGALIVIISPFQLPAHNTVRDYGFLMLSALYTDHCIISSNTVSVGESISILMIYVVYLVLIIADQFLLKYYLKYMEKKAASHKVLRAKRFEEIQNLRNEAGIDILQRNRASRGSGERATVNIEKTRMSSFNEVGGPNDNLVEQFWESLNPIDKEEWDEAGIPGKMYIIFRSPIDFAINATIPIVDYEKDRHNWSKLLNCIQIVMMPIIMIVGIVGYDLLEGGLMLIFYTMIVTIPLALLTYYTTRTDTPPRFHCFMAIYSAVGAMFFIYTSANETVEIMQVLGLITGYSSAFLGATLLAWGNSVGDLVANMALARTGYQKMAYAACVGGPFFNSVLAMGATYLYKSLEDEEGLTTVVRGQFGENCLVFLLLLLFTNLLACLSTNFFSRRSAGYFSVAVYFLFILYVCLGEAELMQTYAKDTGGNLS